MAHKCKCPPPHNFAVRGRISARTRAHSLSTASPGHRTRVPPPRASEPHTCSLMSSKVMWWSHYPPTPQRPLWILAARSLAAAPRGNAPAPAHGKARALPTPTHVFGPAPRLFLLRVLVRLPTGHRSCEDVHRPCLGFHHGWPQRWGGAHKHPCVARVHRQRGLAHPAVARPRPERQTRVRPCPGRLRPETTRMEGMAMLSGRPAPLNVAPATARRSLRPPARRR